MEKKTYLCIMYKNFKYYKKYNKFYEISFITNQVEIKEKYMDKDKYKMEFFEIPQEYEEKVINYI